MTWLGYIVKLHKYKGFVYTWLVGNKNKQPITPLYTNNTYAKRPVKIRHEFNSQQLSITWPHSSTPLAATMATVLDVEDWVVRLLLTDDADTRPLAIKAAWPTRLSVNYHSGERDLWEKPLVDSVRERLGESVSLGISSWLIVRGVCRSVSSGHAILPTPESPASDSGAKPDWLLLA